MNIELKNYQKEMVNKIILNKRVGLFLDMGLGKTLISLVAIKSLLLLEEINKVLVIAPKKVAQSTWNTEIEKFKELSNLEVSLVLGSKKEKIEALNKKADIYVTNRESTILLFNDIYLRKPHDFDLIIFDESTSFKNPSSLRFKAIKKHIYPDTRVLLLTGTPLSNSFEDLWSQIYLLDKGERLERTLTAFRDRYFSKCSVGSIGIYKYELKAGAKEIITKKLEDICFSLKSSDYLELPDLVYNDIEVYLEDKELKKYKDFEKNLVLELEKEEITVLSRAALFSKLLQASNGAVYDDNGSHILFSDAKLEALKELVESLGEQNVLLFYSFKSDKERILEAFEKSKLVVKALDSDEEVRQWNEGKINILLAHPQSTAYGLNLQFGGNNIIWFGLTTSTEMYIQANKRLHRRGQEKPVIIHHLLTKDTQDKKILSVLQQKEDANNAFMEIIKAGKNRKA